MRISAINLTDLVPFKSGTEIEFSEGNALSPSQSGDVHLFTGINGTGKSRLLSVLASASSEDGRLQVANFPKGLVVNAFQDLGNKVCLTLWDGYLNVSRVFLDAPDFNQFKRLSFAFGPESRLERSDISIMSGGAVPTAQERLSFGKWNSRELNQRIANLKVQAAVDLMNSVSGELGRWGKIVTRLEQAISRVTQKRFSVVATAQPTPGLSFQWGKALIPIEGLPAGLNSLLTWVFAAATVADLHFPDSPDPLAEPMIFFLDEVEAWLHPEWQIQVLPLATSLFPNSQFFVASHSPFVICSMNEGYIYRLEETDEGVIIHPGDPAPKGDSFMFALSKFLGFDKLFDQENEGLLAKFREERKAALGGDDGAETRLKELAVDISGRSPELANIIGMEMKQYDKLVAAR